MNRAVFRMLLPLLMIYCTFPLFWQGITSLKTDAEVTMLPPILPSDPTFLHYVYIFTEHPLLRIIVNSAVVSAATTLLAVALGSLAAFGLAKLTVPYRAAIMGFVLSVTMFPAIATVSPLFIIVRALGLRDTLWSLIITYTTFSLPFAIWLLTNFFAEIPDEVYRAARVDGCSPFQAFRMIMLPLSAPGIFTTAILIFISSWNEFLYAITFTATPAARTIPVAIAMFPGQREVPWGDISAASMVVTIPLVILVFAFQRRIVEGLTAGSVKG
ncbi:MAG TPA: carbohydrate ABC transporter permease [Verrucomicrobiae bacterium]|nr:carbohydrate ABC transporter permease [Verrucomicrobiae bacterium]